MPQTGAAGPGRSDRGRAPLPPPIVAFDPLGEISAADTRGRHRVDGAADRDSAAASAGSSATARAAMAEQFAARFGIEDDGPSAAALADRFGFRYEPSDAVDGETAGRRTVTITGHGAARAVPPTERTLQSGSRRGTSAARVGFWLQSDRAALWAVGLALLLALVAAMSAHAIPHI